jgi:preprotein translocase subunit SecY
MVYVSVIITEAERPIPVHYAKQVRAGYQTGGTDTYIPLRIAQAGVMPIIFAGSILQLPQIIAFALSKSVNPKLLGIAGSLKSFTSTNVWYMITYFILIFFFTYFYTAVTFDAESMSNNLQKNGAFIPGVRPGASTAEYVATLLSRTTFFGAIFFAIIAVMPFLLQKLTGNSLFAIGGTGILIGVSVCTDLIKKISAQASMREY